LVQAAGRVGVLDSDLQPMEEETQRVLHPAAPAVQGFLTAGTKQLGILAAASLMAVAMGLLLFWMRRAPRSANKRPTA
jgi:hypothetical protein